MRKNHVKQALESGKSVINGWTHIPSLWSAELMGHAGWDSVTVDMQHGLMGMERAIEMMQVLSGTAAVPFARCRSNTSDAIMKLLDGGAYGIICPMINNEKECKMFVDACLYPPLGNRSFGPTRGRIYGGADYGEHANAEILKLAMIETKEAVENIDAIMEVPGLDGIFVGSGDLKLSLTGKSGHDQSPKEFDVAIDTILESCIRHSKIPGIWTANTQSSLSLKTKGFKFITISSDGFLLANAAKKCVSQFRSNEA